MPREDSIQLIPAQTDATVVRIRVLPGTKVTPDTILMDLADPELQQKLLDAQLQLKGAKADYKSLQATLQSTLMDKKAAAAAVNSAYTQDELQAKTDKQLYDLGVISGLTYNASKNTADQLTTQQQISQEQIDVNHVGDRGPAGLAADQDRSGQGAARPLREAGAGASGAGRHLGRAGYACHPIAVGQHVTAGTSVAEVVQLDKLKATLNIAETQAHDIQLDQPAEVDTHNGIVPGHVTQN